MARHKTVALLGVVALTLSAQEWRHVGNSSLLIGLAGPASGPVERVWFEAAGVVRVKTVSGAIFENRDLDGWQAVPPGTIPPAQSDVEARRKPQAGVALRALARRSATRSGAPTTKAERGATWSG